jgi:hypothetical protein
MIHIVSLHTQFGSILNEMQISWLQMNAGTRELLSVVAAVALASVLGIILILGVRQYRQHRRASQPPTHSHRRQRRRRRAQRMNPTLAETHGLPPARSDKDSSPAP